MSSVSGPCESVDASSSSSFPRRRTSAIVAPSSALSGGSNVLSTLMPGVMMLSIACPGSAADSLRATISISGSSGIDKTLACRRNMDPWIAETAAEIAHRIPRELEALVGVSSPSGDVAGAEECIAVCALLLPEEAEVERIPCSSANHAQDTVARLRGTGSRRALLLGHVDTVVQHAQHKPLARVGEQLVGSGS